MKVAKQREMKHKMKKNDLIRDLEIIERMHECLDFRKIFIECQDLESRNFREKRKGNGWLQCIEKRKQKPNLILIIIHHARKLWKNCCESITLEYVIFSQVFSFVAKDENFAEKATGKIKESLFGTWFSYLCLLTSNSMFVIY